MLNNYICALDIGSSKIAACVIRMQNKHIVNIFFESLPSRGMKKGAIIDSIDLINSVSHILKKLRERSGINIKSVYANICGQDIITKHSHAVIPLAERGNKVISSGDLHKVNEQARILGSSLEEEIIHQIPFSYAIDSMGQIKNPLGLYSHRLEVDLLLICAKLSFIQSLTRAINQAGYEIKDLFLCGIATSSIVFNDINKSGINILCDIGSDMTEILIFNDGIIKHIEILHIGGNDFTEELANTLKVPFELAEDVKRSYGIITDYSHTKKDKEILVKKDDIYKSIKQEIVLNIVNGRAGLICQAIKEVVEKFYPSTLINNFLVTGRTALLEGFLEKLENTLGIPVKVARITSPNTRLDSSSKYPLCNRYIQEMIALINKDLSLSGHKYINYLSAIGIISEALQNMQSQAVFSQKNQRNPLAAVINKFKEIYQEYF